MLVRLSWIVWKLPNRKKFPRLTMLDLWRSQLHKRTTPIQHCTFPCIQSPSLSQKMCGCASCWFFLMGFWQQTWGHIGANQHQNFQLSPESPCRFLRFHGLLLVCCPILFCPWICCWSVSSVQWRSIGWSCWWKLCSIQVQLIFVCFVLFCASHCCLVWTHSNKWWRGGAEFVSASPSGTEGD